MAAAEGRATDHVTFHDLNSMAQSLLGNHESMAPAAWNSTVAAEPILKGCPRQV